MLCMIVLLYRIIRKMERGKGAAGGGPGSKGVRQFGVYSIVR